MSLATPQLQTHPVLDPRLNIDSIRRYNILRGGKNISWKPVISSSYSNSSIQITAPPPNPAVIVDREIYMLVSGKLNITTELNINNNTGADVTVTPLGVGYNDALRAYPFSNALCQTLQATINNTAVSINMSDVIEPLLRYNVPEFKRGKIFSMTPSMQDQFQKYSDWLTAVSGNQVAGSARHPLAGYGAISGDEMARGGFASLELKNNTMVVANGTNQNNVKVVEAYFLICEPLFLSPFLFGGEGPGFIGVQTMDFNFTIGNIPRMWSHYDVDYVMTSTAPLRITGITMDNFGDGYGTIPATKPTLLFNYITPGELMPIHREYVYPYFNIDRYPTTVEGSTAAGGLMNIQSSNIQLQSIPRRIYIVVRETNDARNANAWLHSDVYASIEGITVNYNNNAGLLSSAKKQDLYRIAVNNGCQLSWNQWDKYTGSVLALDFGKDIQLGDLEAPGKLMTSQLQIDVRAKNTSSESRSYALYIIVVSEGTFTIVDNRCITQIGVVSEQDIFEASKSKDFQPYSHVENIYGGDFFQGLKKVIKEAAPIVMPVVMEGAKYALQKGLGGELEGAGYSGGKMLSKEKLRERLKKL